MFTKYIALVSETTQVLPAQAAEIASALQKQITRDFEPLWQVPASISFFQFLNQVPSDYWPIIIRDDIGFPGAAGIHLDRNGQPYALVQASQNVALTCSHECLEMLADPFGNRLVASQSLKPEQGRVNYLVEVCDPSEDEQFGYSINGILVSDFYTPNFFDPVVAASVRYSYTGCLNKPREVLDGGYISWMVPATNEWWQAIVSNGQTSFRSLGVLNRNGKSWREVIDSLTFGPVAKTLEKKITTNIEFAKILRASSHQSANNGRANQIHEDIQQLLSNLQQ
jgi:hypothetical protein